MTSYWSRGLRMVGLVMAVALALVLFLTGGVSNARAQMPELDGPLGPDDCVRIALTRNHEVLIAIDQMEQAHGQSRQALSGVLPSISAGGNYRFDHRFTEGGDILLDGVVVASVDDETNKTESRSAYVSLNQSVFDWSSLQGLRSARSTARASRQDVGTTELDIALRVKSRYYEFLKARRLHEVRLESVALRDQQLERAQTLFDVGSVAKNDVLQSRVNLQQARLEEIQARNNVELEKARLAQLMGVSVITEFEIVDNLEMTPPVVVDSLAIWREAMAQRPDLQAARLRLRAGELELSAARGGRYPSVGAELSKYLSDRESSDSHGWSFTAAVSVPIFDGMLTEGRIKSAKAGRVTREDQLRQLELVAALEIKESILGMRDAQQSIAVADEAVALADENLKLASERYQLGSGTLLELEEAQVGLIDARRSLVEAQAALKVAEASLDKARGRAPQR